MAIVTIDDVLAQLNIDADDQDSIDELQPYIDGVTAVIEDYKREVIEPRAVVERLTLSGRSRFRLWSVPVISLTSIVSLDGSQTWDVSGLDVDGDTGLVEVVTGSPPMGRVKVTYQAGYETVPVNYVRGALVVIQHVWETQRGPGAVTASVVGPEEVHDARFMNMFTFPRKAREWLGAPRPVVG